MRYNNLYEFFQLLNESDIKYCHWKSIDRLEEVFNGETDIDILVDKKDAEKFLILLLKFGAKSVTPRSWMVYPNMEDYLLFDKNNGKIYHFHIHYKLIMGHKNIKEYLLPIEQIYLKNRKYSEKYNTYIVDPNIDLAILILRIIQKLTLKSLCKIFFISKDLKKENEILLLIKQINKEDFFNMLKLLDKTLNTEGKLEKLIKKIYSKNYILDFQTAYSLRKLLYDFLTYPKYKIIFLPYFRKFLNNWVALISRNNAKHFRKGGVALALVGADGSGKTTVANSLIKKLRYKLSAKKYYLGCNKRSYSLFAKTLVASSYLFRVFKKVNHINLFANLHLFGILLAEYACLYDRRRLYNQSIKDVENGMIIVYERFPLENTIDYPVCFINKFEIKNKFNFIINFELYLKKEYNKLKKPEELTFWINAPVELIQKRRKMDDKTVLKVKKKYDLVSKYAHKNNLVVLDANNSVEDIVNRILEEIFKR